MSKTTVIKIFGMLFIIIPILMLILSLYGPIAIIHRSQMVVFPLHSIDMEPEETDKLSEYIEQAANNMSNYIITPWENAEAILEQKDYQWDDSHIYTQALEFAKVIQIEKFMFCVAYHTSEQAISIFISISDTQYETKIVNQIIQIPSLDQIDQIKQNLAEIDVSLKKLSINDTLYFIINYLNILLGILLLCFTFIRTKNRILKKVGFKVYSQLLLRVPEILFVLALITYIFAFIFALNADMDYVQKFMATGGKLNLALDTTTERINLSLRFMPIILINGICLVFFRIKGKTIKTRHFKKKNIFYIWALPMVMVAGIITALAFPSFLNLDGFSFLALLGVIPLLLVFKHTPLGSSFFYGSVFSAFYVLFANSWMGTYSLISFVFVGYAFTLEFMIFIFLAALLYKFCKKFSFWVLPLAWVVFDCVRSYGFIGYPWSILGASQYNFLALIQVASITGVWGLTFLVLLINSILAELISNFIYKKKLLSINTIVALVMVGVCFFGGLTYILFNNEDADPNARKVRIALIQPNSDPRKHVTRQTVEDLKQLTAEALSSYKGIDMVVWPECAVNLNIKNYVKRDDTRFGAVKIVHELLDFIKQKKIWLATGYPDYIFELTEEGKEQRIDFNSSILINPRGEILQTYHKLHLVPFTEYFPYQEELPWLWEFIKDFDTSFWEKGSKRVVFEHEKFSYFTPICFEDSFPAEISAFVQIGADIIANMSNDFWALTPVEGKQHAVNSLFRALENRRPLVRSTASGLTCYIDTMGRIRDSVPYYEKAYIVADVPIIKNRAQTIYTMLGDWFPTLCFVALLVFCAIQFLFWLRQKLQGRK